MTKTLAYMNNQVSGVIHVPGDKSISHRAIMFGSLAKGETIIRHLLQSDDCLRTIDAFRALGVSIEISKNLVRINSQGADFFKKPKETIDLGNSGTTARLLLGILAALPFEVKIDGDTSLRSRPMGRIIRPLEQMGANIHSNKEKLPIQIKGGNLNAITYNLPVDSAQIKSGILLAGLLTEGKTTVIENNVTRDHTERMIPKFGGDIQINQKEISIKGRQQLIGTTIDVPGDLSSASFWIVAAVITPNSHLEIKGVGLNPSRLGVINVLKRMGANIKLEITGYVGSEPVGNIIASYSSLKPTEINKDEIPLMVDEVPLLALAASQAKGSMMINHVKELRFKETDRVKATVEVLKTLNVSIYEQNDSIVINGPSRLTGGKIKTFGDHRIAMMASIASIICNKPVIIDDSDCVNISYPTFYDQLEDIVNPIE